MERIGAFYRRQLKTFEMQIRKGGEEEKKDQPLMPGSFGNGVVGQATRRAAHGGLLNPGGFRIR